MIAIMALPSLGLGCVIYHIGYIRGKSEFRENLPTTQVLSIEANQSNPTPTIQSVIPTSVTAKTKVNSFELKRDWGGLELWEALNRKRLNNNVEQLAVREDLCTISSVRLNQLLEKGDLDGHEGFNKLETERPDLYKIIKRYKVVAEFLARGGSTAEATVGLWENTLGHRKLLVNTDYEFGCVYAQDTYAVAIAAY